MRRSRWHRSLQTVILAVTATVCIAVLAGAGHRIPWVEVLGFGLLASVLRLRSVPLLKDRDGTPLFSHIPGESILLIAILRHGPETAVAVGLLTNLIAVARLWQEFSNSNQRLSAVANAFFLSAAGGVFGFLYQSLGGLRVVGPDDCDTVFDMPFRVEVPLLVSSILVFELIYRLYYAISLHLGYGLSLRRVVLDYKLGLFRHVENVGALIGLVLWTRWGVGTVPFTALMMEALLLAAREFFQRIELRGEVVTDPLTGLANARGLQDEIQSQIRNGNVFCLLFLDLDNFKQVNDRFGHGVGDDLLRRTAESLRRSVRSADLVGRLGGDEFVVVLAETTPGEAVLAARRLARNLERTYTEHPQAVSAEVGTSLGIAAYPADGQSVEALLERADKRMYFDKRDRKEVLPDRSLRAA